MVYKKVLVWLLCAVPDLWLGVFNVTEPALQFRLIDFVCKLARSIRTQHFYDCG